MTVALWRCSTGTRPEPRPAGAGTTTCNYPGEFTEPDNHSTCQNLADRVDLLLNTITNDKTGSPYTDAQVARMSLGVLTEDEVAGIRAGMIPNPTVDKLVALARVFGVEPGYFLDGVEEPPMLDREALDILRDETTSAIARKSFRLPGSEKRMILNIIDELENARRARDQEKT